MFNLQTDFYKPLWIRIAIVAVCFGWAIFEVLTGQTLWALLFVGLGAVATHQFFLDGWPATETSDQAVSDQVASDNKESREKE